MLTLWVTAFKMVPLCTSASGLPKWLPLCTVAHGLSKCPPLVGLWATNMYTLLSLGYQNCSPLCTVAAQAEMIQVHPHYILTPIVPHVQGMCQGYGVISPGLL